MNFRERNDAELGKLASESEEKLIAYIVAARRAGRSDAAVQAARVLAFRYERRIRGFVLNRLGSKGRAVCDEVAEMALAGAIASVGGFEGSTAGEFRAFVFRIAGRRIADYHRKGRVEEEPLEVDWGEGEQERGATAGQKEADPLRAVDDASVFNQAFGELNDSHKLVICLVRFYDLPHKKVAEQVNRHFGSQLNDPMSEQNVNKINSRFDKRLGELLAEADDPPLDDG